MCHREVLFTTPAARPPSGIADTNVEKPWGDFPLRWPAGPVSFLRGDKLWDEISPKIDDLALILINETQFPLMR
jgi:hypothetical protein